MKNIKDLRTDYTLSKLNKCELNSCPIDQFKIWFNEVIHQIIEPTAMTLSTYTKEYGCQSRVVLLKEINDDGFVFFTNYYSLKAKQIDLNNNVALSFFWPNLQRQIRINGLAIKLNPQISADYFSKRPRKSQISAWVSSQSEIIKNRDVIELKFQQMEKKFKNKAIPKPNYWGGYVVQPLSIEFWQGREDRLHDRFIYIKSDNEWVLNRLSP